MRKRWFALQCVTGTEQTCLRKIRNAGFCALAPTRTMPERRGGRWQERENVMLPGYLFVACGMGVMEYYLLSGIPEVIRILPGNGRAIAVPDEQMEWIMTLSNGGEPWGISRGVCREGKPEVTDGPLLGRESMILSWDRRRHRARIAIRLLDKQREIDVGLIDNENQLQSLPG